MPREDIGPIDEAPPPAAGEAVLALPAAGRLMDKGEIVARLGISKRYFEEIQAAGQIPVLKIGRTARYEWRAVLLALRKNFGVAYFPEEAAARE